MDDLRCKLEEIVYEIEEKLKRYTNEMDGYPDGNLIRCFNSGKDRYYIVRNRNGVYSRMSARKDPETAKKLVRKEYLEKAVPILAADKRVIEEALSRIESADIDSVKRSLSMAYQSLPDELFFGCDSVLRSELSGEEKERVARHLDWANMPYEKSDYKPEGLRFMTSSGIRVRSKSELLIAEENYNQHALFRYEQFGIVPWENLIVTYDINGIINAPMIKSIVEHDVIPRL